MGAIYETVTLRNLVAGGDAVELLVLVDTGAMMLVVPGWVQDQLRLPLVRRASVRYANEATAQREVVGPVELTVCDRTGNFDAVVEPARQQGLLGVIVLEALDLIADTTALKLYPNPRSPDIPMTDIEEAVGL